MVTGEAKAETKLPGPCVVCIYVCMYRTQSEMTTSCASFTSSSFTSPPTLLRRTRTCFRRHTQLSVRGAFHHSTFLSCTFKHTYITYVMLSVSDALECIFYLIVPNNYNLWGLCFFISYVCQYTFSSSFVIVHSMTSNIYLNVYYIYM